MKITAAMKKEGWKRVNGTWVAPVEKSSKKEGKEVLIEESRLGTGWVRVKPHQVEIENGFKRLGLSQAEAALAAGGKVAPPDDNTPFGILRKQLTRVRVRNAELTD